MTNFNRYHVVLLLLVLLIFLSGYWLFKLYTTDKTVHASSVIQKQTSISNEITSLNKSVRDSINPSTVQEKEEAFIPEEKTPYDSTYNNKPELETYNNDREEVIYKMQEGFYLVVGVFRHKSNALNHQKTYAGLLTNTFITYNDKEHKYYVFTSYFNLNMESDVKKALENNISSLLPDEMWVLEYKYDNL